MSLAEQLQFWIIELYVMLILVCLVYRALNFTRGARITKKMLQQKYQRFFFFPFLSYLLCVSVSRKQIPVILCGVSAD